MHKITLEISADDWKILCNDLEDPEKWIRDAVAGKIHACAKRILKRELEIVDPLSVEQVVPLSPRGIIQIHLDRPDYKNRAQRTKEQQDKIKEKRRGRLEAPISLPAEQPGTGKSA